MLKFTAVVVFALMTLPVWAINKCKTTDGKVVFQDAPCAGEGGKIEVRPASGSALQTSAPAASAATPPQPAALGTKKEGPFGANWQRKTYLENRGIADARGALNSHQAQCEAKQKELAAKKGLARNNLAGATWEQSISTEMQAAATVCDSRSRDLRANLESLEKELRELQSQQ
jgi:hypothetical protein